MAARVLWAADEIGDGLGFDVLSSDAVDESERRVELKTRDGLVSPNLCLFQIISRCQLNRHSARGRPDQFDE